MLVVAPIFSRDVFSYAAQGEMMSRHINPYHYGPGHARRRARTPTRSTRCGINTPAPYGPLFLMVDGFFASASLHNELVTVVLLRLFALAGVVLIAWCIPKLARAYGRDAGPVFVLAVLNPLVLLTLVGRGPQRRHHGRAAGRRDHRGQAEASRAGGWCCAPWPPPSRPRRPSASSTSAGSGWAPGSRAPAGAPLGQRRDRRHGGGGACSSVLSGLGWGWVANLATPGTVRSWLAPATGIGMGLSSALAHAVGLGVSSAGVLSVTRVLGLLAAAAAASVYLLEGERPHRGPERPRPQPAAVRRPRTGGPAVVPDLGDRPAGPGGRRPAADDAHRAVGGRRRSSACPAGAPCSTSSSTPTRCRWPLALVVLVGVLLAPARALGRPPGAGAPRRRGRAGHRRRAGAAEPALGTSEPPGPQSRRWSSTTSSQRPCLRPISRSTPTSSKPHARCRAIDASLWPTIRAITVWKPCPGPARPARRGRPARRRAHGGRGPRRPSSRRVVA